MMRIKTCQIGLRRFCSNNSSNEVIFEVINDVGIITLNRPAALNALTENMVNAIYSKLKLWERLCSFVMIQGNGDAFCAGSDLKTVIQDRDAAKSMFRNQYKLNYLIGRFRIPYVSILDGIAMGSGAGLSMHGTFRIATENTLFAMPNNSIGLFPDNGSSFFLPRLKRNIGVFLGLTGHRVQGADTVNYQINTHFVFQKNLSGFLKKLLQLDPYDLADFLRHETEDISKVPHCLNRRELDIDCYFQLRTVEEILFALHRDTGFWHRGIATLIEKNSPVSVKVTKALLDIGVNRDLRECLKIEYRLACAAIDKKITSDFYEGVRAELIDKDKSPKWDPDHISEVTDNMMAKVFAPLLPSEELDL